MHSSAVASLNQQLHIRIHKRHGHSNVRTIRKHKVGVLAELLNEGEDVIPTTTVQSRAVFAQLVDDLIHLKRRRDGLDQHGTTDRSARHANVVLSQVEDVVPQTRLEVRLHLGEVEVRAEPAGNELLGIVVEVQTEVEQTAGDGGAVDSEVLLVEVPATSASNESGEHAVCPQLVFLTTLCEIDLATDGVVEVDLAVDHVFPGRSAGICLLLDAIFRENPGWESGHTLKISHVCPDIRVQRVDDHLAICGTGDFHTAVDETRSWGSTLPGIVLTNVLCLGQEVGEVTLVNLGLAVDTALEEGLASRVEGAVEDGEEGTGVLGEDLASFRAHIAEDDDVLELGIDLHHGGGWIESLLSYREVYEGEGILDTIRTGRIEVLEMR